MGFEPTTNGLKARCSAVELEGFVNFFLGLWWWLVLWGGSVVGGVVFVNWFVGGVGFFGVELRFVLIYEFCWFLLLCGGGWGAAFLVLPAAKRVVAFRDDAEQVCR